MITWYLIESDIIPDTWEPGNLWYLFAGELLFIDTPMALFVIWTIRSLLGI